MTLPDLNSTAKLDTAPWSKGIGAVLKDLRTVQELGKKIGTLTITAKLAGTSMAAMKQQVDAAVGGRTLPFNITLDANSIKTAVASLKTSLSAVVGLNLSSLTAIQVQINGQIQQMTALIAQLRALGGSRGGGGGGGAGAGLSANTRQLLADLEATNNAYRQGTINANTYATRLAGLQSALRVAAAGAAQGTTEFKALDRAVTQTVQGLRSVQTAGITQLRTELAGARAQFDAAAAAATSLAQRRAAIAAYEGDLNRIRVALGGMASSGRLTAEQLGAVNRMLAMTAREANSIRGGVNIAGLSGNIQNALQNLMQFNPVLGQTQAIFGTLPVPIMATVGAIGLLGAAFASSFRTAAEFQQGMKDISALTQPTANDLRALKEAALFGGADLGVGPRAMAASLLELNKAGLSTEDVLNGGAEATLNLAGAAGIAADQAGKLAVAAKTAFGLAAQDMPGIADTFANFANQTFLAADDLSQAIAAVGPVAKTAGLSLNEFSGYMATLAQGGFKNMSDAGTSLKTMLLSLQAPSETAAGALEELKLNVYDAAGNMRPMADVLGDLREKLKGLTEQQKNQYLKDIFGTDGIRAATILLGQSQAAIQGNIDAMGKQGEAARVAKERMDTFQGAMKQLNASWEAFKITVGEKALPVMTDLVKGLKGGVDTLQDFANGTKSLVPYIVPLVTVFVGLRGAVIAAAAPAIWTAITTAIGTFFATVTAWAAANPFGAVAVAVGALGAAVNKIMQDTANIYDQVDKANQDSFEATMKRVRELMDEGTELGRVQAKYLLAVQTLAEAQQGDVKGVNWKGERVYSVDPARVKEAQDRVNALRGEMVLLRTEAGRHNQTKTEVGGPGLSIEQLKKREAAIASLRKSLEERAFTLKLEGMADLDKTIAQSRHEFEKLKEDLSKPFGGNTNNSAYKAAVKELTTQQLAEEKAIRKQYADKAVLAAKESALKVQAAEISAMQEGRAKKHAERQAEIDEVRRDALKEADQYKDSPTQRKQIISDGERQIAALRSKFRQEDIDTAKEHGRRVQDAETRAAQAVVSGMQDGYAKQELTRRLALEALKRDIQDRVEALKGDPEAQTRVKVSGQQEVANQIQADNLARLRETEEAQAAIRDAELSGADARIAAMKDGFAKEEALRAQALVKLKNDYQKRIDAEKGRPDVQQALMGERDIAVASLEQQNARARIEAIRSGNDAVYEAQKAARAAENALIKNDLAKKQAAQNEEFADLERSIQKKLEGFKGTEEQRRKILEAGQAQVRALSKKHLQEDADDARERAHRIADAWNEVQGKQFAAQQAGRARELAQFEADAARRARALSETPVPQAQAAADDVSRRFALQREASTKQFAWEEQQAAYARDKSLRAENLTAEQKKTIWAEYNATLKKLGEDRAADETRSLGDEAAAARAARDALRAAYLAESNRPVQRSQNRVQELQWAKDLSRSDAEILRINQDISAERERQIEALQGQLLGLGGVVLTDEQRQQVEQQIKQLQHDQTVTLKEQEGTQRALTASTLDRLDVEAQYAERVARTSVELDAARRSQLAVMQARVRELDSQIAGEGREQERNALIGQRYGLLGQILDLTTKINDAPLDNEKRKLGLYKAQAETQLIASGLQNNEAEKARLTLQIAAQELLIANQRVATAQGQLAMEAALSEQAQARLAFAQAYAALLGQEMPMPGGGTAAQVKSEAERNRERQESLKRQRDLESELLDVAEARARALQVIRGEGESAVQNAELELQFTRERLALVTRQLDEDGTDAANRASLLRERLTLLQQEVEQERRVTEARRAAADLADELAQAESALTAALAGGQMAAEGEATRRLAQARQALTRAEEAYARARSEGDPSKIKDATEKLTSAIQAQRSAVAGLADVYRQQIAGMDSVREASERLKQAAYGEDGPVFNAGRERQRLDAISQRRNAAQTALAEALKGGDTGLIQKATEELTRQQERVNKQIEYLNKNGQKVTDAGQRRTQVLSDQVDLLGISYDREAVNLAERAQIVDQESQNAMTLSAAATSFADATESLKRLDLAKQVEGIATELAAALKQAKLDADREALASRLTGGGGSTGAAPQAMRFDPASINQLAQQFAGKLPPLGKIEGAVQAGTQSALESLKPGLVTLPGITPTTQPAPNYSYVLNVGGISITAPSDRAADIRRTVNEALDDRIADARRTKSWGGNKCP